MTDATTTAPEAPAQPVDKTLERLRALAALRGLRVHALDVNGGFVVIDGRGWAGRALPDLHAVAQALRALGVPA